MTNRKKSPIEIQPSNFSNSKIVPKVKTRAPRNRTVTIYGEEEQEFKNRLLVLKQRVEVSEIDGRTIWAPLEDTVPFLPARFVDLVFVDPPYNLDKDFGNLNFRKMKASDYEGWLDAHISLLLPLLKETSSIYVCGDWESSPAIYNVLKKYFTIRNRITWEREKGRGALNNWKNCSEDIWYATLSDKYYFNVEAVKLKRRVIAPYRTGNGKPKDWLEEGEGNFRTTFPSNLWTDLSVPFWSMPENTDHPTQKPEKLLAKLILASSAPGDFVFDPFLGSGTTSVVAKKLKRRFSGVEQDLIYACLAEKRLKLAELDNTIQGFADGVFWERNTYNLQKNHKQPEIQ